MDNNNNNEDYMEINEIQSNECMSEMDIPVINISYKNHRRRGRCLILDHQVFDPHLNLDDRGEGTVTDCQDMTTCFKKLGFDVFVMSDPTHRQIEDQMTIIACEDHSDSDCLLVVVVTHGDEQHVYARDTPYRTETLFSYFKPILCPSLAGKPKIFIIQACRGINVDFGWKMLKSLGGPSPDLPHTTQYVYKIPVMADFLVYYSTVPGYVSWKHKVHGSPFIQTIVKVLNQYCCIESDYDLVTLFTFVNQLMAKHFPKYQTLDHMKQIPCIQSMLTKRMFLSPKSNNS